MTTLSFIENAVVTSKPAIRVLPGAYSSVCVHGMMSQRFAGRKWSREIYPAARSERSSSAITCGRLSGVRWRPPLITVIEACGMACFSASDIATGVA